MKLGEIIVNIEEVPSDKELPWRVEIVGETKARGAGVTLAGALAMAFRVSDLLSGEAKQELAKFLFGRSFDFRITYLCAYCGSFAEVSYWAVEVFDSGTTLSCDKCGENTVFDLSTPEDRARKFKEGKG